MSSQQIDYSSIIAPVTSYKLYNPSEEEVSRDFAAKSFRFPPAHEDRFGLGPGVVAIGDVKIRGHEDQKGYAAVETMPALDVVRYFCGHDGRSGKLGVLGIRLLTGNPTQDAQIKAEAREACTEAKYQHCLQLKAAHLSRVQKEKEAGQPLTPPDKTIRDAMAYVAKVDAERGTTALITCPDCGWGLQSNDELPAHIASIHPEKAQQVAEVAPTAPAQVAARPVQASAGRPRPRG